MMDKLLNKNGKVGLSGLEFDNPLDQLPIPKREFREFNEGIRTKIKEIWVERYIPETNGIGIERQSLQMTNRGVCFLDGKQLKDKDNIEKTKYIFDNLQVSNR